MFGRARVTLSLSKKKGREDAALVWAWFLSAWGESSSPHTPDISIGLSFDLLPCNALYVIAYRHADTCPRAEIAEQSLQ